jgi:hypothetical protein
VSRWVESVERRIDAPAAQLYTLVSDPERHREFDGSDGLVGVTEVSTPTRPLRVGDYFTMDMDLRGRYSMTSTVIEAIPNRRFAWQSRPHPSCAAWRRKFFGGRIWRYDFEPDGGATIVRESWDLSEEPGRLGMIWFGFEVRKIMRRSLDRMAAIVRSE